MILRPGDWRPGAASPALLAVQLLTTSQAALRGLSYLRDGVADRGALALAESTASPTTWGLLFLGTSTAVLVGLAGRWPGLLILAHLLLGAVYIGLGVTVLALIAVPSTLLALSLVCAVGGSWIVAFPYWSSTAVRLLAGIPLLLTAAVGTATALGSGHATGSGLVVGGLAQVALAGGVFITSNRTRLAREVDREVRELADAR